MRSSQILTFKEFKTLATIVFVAMCGMLGTDIHLASLPHIMAYMHTDKAHMQQSVSIFLLGMGVSLLFYGPLSDKYGRKPIIIFGLLLASLASFAAVFTQHINPFLFLRLLQGIGCGVCMGVGRAVIADVLQGDRLASIGSYFVLVVSLSPLIAPMLGGYIQQWFGWQANFIVLGSIIGLSLIGYVAFCPETNLYLNPSAVALKSLYQNYRSLLTHPLFVGATLIAGAAMAGNMAYATISPFVFQIQFHMSPVVYGWITAVAGVGGFLGKLTTPLSVRFLGSQSTLRLGVFLLLFSGLWLVGFILCKLIDVPLIMVAVLLMFFSQSLMVPITISLALSSFQDTRGSASALYGSFQMLTAFLASAIVGVVSHNGVIVLATAYCILGVFAVIVYFGLVKRQIKQ